MADSTNTVVREDPENHRYIIEIDGELAAFTVDHIRGGRHFFVHTATMKGYEGRGAARTLVRGALDDVRSRGEKIVPLCPYVAAFVKKHPEYDDIVDHRMWDRVEGRSHIDRPD